MTTPIEIVKKLLTNTLDRDVVKELVAPTATYVSLCYHNPKLKQVMTYAGRHDREGPTAVSYTFETVNRIWANEDFKIDAIFGEGEDVAVFGRFTYRSRTLGKRYTSPFNVWCKVRDGRIVYMQFMEDTFGTAQTFEKDGSAKKMYWVDNGEDGGKELQL